MRSLYLNVDLYYRILHNLLASDFHPSLYLTLDNYALLSIFFFVSSFLVRTCESSEFCLLLGDVWVWQPDLFLGDSLSSVATTLAELHLILYLDQPLVDRVD